MSSLLLGCIADDFTGATDLANTLARAGMRVVQTIGVPDDTSRPDADAVVVALKSRTAAVSDAVAQSVDACRWLRRHGAGQIYFKVCSTFDSTPQGNIGPVLEALMDELACAFCIVTPAFPETGRTVYQGHLFVGDSLLNDSSMRDHPLTPMTDANLVRVLERQLSAGKGRRVGLINLRHVAAGAGQIRERMAELQSQGCSLAIADAVTNDDLTRLGAAAADLPLICAASGLAIGLPRNWGITPSATAALLPPADGRRAIVSGSCSTATNAQVAHFIHSGGAAWPLDPLRLDAGSGDALAAQADEVAAWAERHWRAGPHRAVLVYSTARADDVQAVQSRLGAQRAGGLIEQALARIACRLVAQGARQLILAGGETSGACIGALNVTRLQIGRQIDPGVPWCHAHSPVAGEKGMHVALKSGNFGATDFFSRAFTTLA
ncbi:four-carbon acid sugar kinase family protein [Vineibacter terrae]|uniref:3-oxo-tetronate kinase n=1 Tax=Vineibacter terrae TaxID=2586908 RepID=A0A5C8P8E0_9HYPH|nr:3-oxo-tetronate kinase [Vineibacter terrae]TXL70061.1 four-carbon acid sugar kinase family protein [Vineibacter terrae]